MFIKAHRRIVLAVLLSILFLIFVLIFSSQGPMSGGPTPSTVPTVTPISSRPGAFPTSIKSPENIHHEEDELREFLETRAGLQKKEALQDGTTRYIFTSPVAGREDMVLTNKDEILLQRSVINPAYPVSLANVTTAYKQPDLILKGSYYYDETTQIYIYAARGLAFVINPQTNNVLEKYIFYPTTAQNFLRDFGEDIIER